VPRAQWCHLARPPGVILHAGAIGMGADPAAKSGPGLALKEEPPDGASREEPVKPGGSFRGWNFPALVVAPRNLPTTLARHRRSLDICLTAEAPDPDYELRARANRRHTISPRTHNSIPRMRLTKTSTARAMSSRESGLGSRKSSSMWCQTHPDDSRRVAIDSSPQEGGEESTATSSLILSPVPGEG